MIDSIPVLVRPVDVPNIESLETCYNCGNNIFRIRKTWGAVKKEIAKELDKSKMEQVRIIDIDFFCAICGSFTYGYEIYSREACDEETFETEKDAKEYLDDRIAEEGKT